MEQQQYLLNLEQLLKQIATPTPDNNTIIQSTELLKKNYFVNEQCIPALMEIISNSKDISIRHLASVEFPKQIRNHFSKLDDNLKTQIEQRLLEIIVVEPEKIICHAIARCISSIAEYELENNRWTNLFDFLFQCCQSSNPSHREVGVFVIYSLYNVIYENKDLRERIPQIFELFSVTINDQESIDVKITTMKALGIIAEYIDDSDENDKRSIELFRALIPSVVNALQQCLELNNEEGVQAGFEIIEILLTSETSIISDSFVQLIELTLNIAKNQQYDEGIRNMALSTIFLTSVYKKTKLIRMNLCKPIIDSIFPIGTEEEPEDEDEDSPSRIVYRILNGMANNIPNYVFQIIMDYITNYMQNPNPMYRKAALMSLWQLVDGCADSLRQKINDILTFIASGLQDSEPVVRKAACIAFYFISIEMSEEVSVHHASFIPLIFNLMNDQDILIQKHATNALNALLEGLNEDIVQYLPMLADKFINLLDTGAVENKAIIVEAIGSAALSASDKFLTYFEAFYPRILHMMSFTTGTEELLIRSVATNTMGLIAEAVGKDVFRPYVQKTMELVMEGLNIDSPKLKEQSFYYFAVLAKVFGSEFSPFLSAIMPPIIKSLNQNENFDDLFNEEYLEDMDEEEAEEKTEQLFSTSNAIAEEKELAAECVQEIFAATKSEFMPYFEPCIEALKQLVDHIFEGVRKSSAVSLISIISICNEMCGGEKWQPGLPLKVQIHQDVATLISTVMPLIMANLKKEESKITVIGIFAALAEDMKKVGPALIADCHKDLAEILLMVFDRSHNCQIDYEDDENSQEEKLEETEYESIVISNASDVIGSMALVLGNEFLEYFKSFFQPIMNFYSPTKAANERNMAIGVLGEVATGLKEQITEFTENILQVLMVALKDEDSGVNSNAAFAIGQLCEHTNMDISSFYPEIFTLLFPLFNAATALPTTIDNACGAVSRLLLRYPNSVPIEQVLPTFFGALPLKTDYEENVPVVKFLKYLLETQNPFVISNKAEMAKLFQVMLSPPENQLNAECRDLVMKMAQSL